MSQGQIEVKNDLGNLICNIYLLYLLIFRKSHVKGTDKYYCAGFFPENFMPANSFLGMVNRPSEEMNVKKVKIGKLTYSFLIKSISCACPSR